MIDPNSIADIAKDIQHLRTEVGVILFCSLFVALQALWRR